MSLKIDFLLLFLIPSITSLGLCFGNPADFANDLAILRLCNASSQVSLETVNSVLVHRDLHNSQAKSAAFKCFLLCLYKEYGWMDRDGGFELHSIKSSLLSIQMPKNRIRSLIYTCTSTDSIDPCDRASIFTECFWSQSSYKNDNFLENETSGLAGMK